MLMAIDVQRVPAGVHLGTIDFFFLISSFYGKHIFRSMLAPKVRFIGAPIQKNVKNGTLAGDGKVWFAKAGNAEYNCCFAEDKARFLALP